MKWAWIRAKVIGPHIERLAVGGGERNTAESYRSRTDDQRVIAHRSKHVLELNDISTSNLGSNSQRHQSSETENEIIHAANARVRRGAEISFVCGSQHACRSMHK